MKPKQKKRSKKIKTIGKILLYIFIMMFVLLGGSWLIDKIVGNGFEKVYNQGFQKGLEACEFYKVNLCPK